MNNLGYSERRSCQVVGLERSTYYALKHHRPSDREIRQMLLEDAIAGIYQRSRGTYGVRRIRAALEIEQGLIVNYKLVMKLMRRLGIKGIPGPKKGHRNMVNAATNEDLVQRQFHATKPNELWLTDITEHPTREAKVYCCCVLDLFSRKIVGFSISRHCDSDLAPNDRRDCDSLRPRQSVHVVGLLTQHCANWTQRIHGHYWRLLRQCAHGVLLEINAD